MAKLYQSQVECLDRNLNMRKSRGEETDAKYTSEDLRSAINELGKGVSLSQIALKYNIPKSTLFRKSKDPQPSTIKDSTTTLTEAEERHIAQWINYRKEQGYPLTKKKIVDYVQKYLNNSKRKTIFKNNKPGACWYEYFLKRYSISIEEPRGSNRVFLSVQDQRIERREQDCPDLPILCKTGVDIKVDGQVSNNVAGTSNSLQLASTDQGIFLKRNSKKDEQVKYTLDDLKAALNELGKGVSLSRIARKYDIPKSTLFRKSKNLTPIACKKGPPTVLTEAEEKHVAAWINYRLDQGFPVSRKKIIDYVQKFLNSSKKVTPFQNNRPGIHWYRSFMKRQSIFSVRGVQIFKCDPSLMDEDQEEYEEEQGDTSNMYASPNNQTEEVTEGQNPDQIVSVLNFIENHLIGPDILQSFQSTYEELGITEPQGISQEALFEVWCELQRMSGRERRLDNSFQDSPSKIDSQEGSFRQSQCTSKIDPEFIYVINNEQDSVNGATCQPTIVNTVSQAGIQNLHLVNQGDQSLSDGATANPTMDWNPQLSPEEAKEVETLESQRQKRDKERERIVQNREIESKKLGEQKNALEGCEKTLSGRMKQIEEKMKNGFSSGNNGVLGSEVNEIFSHLYDIEKTLLELVKQGLYKIDSEGNTCS